MTSEDSLKLTGYIIMGVATIALVFFVVNLIRCRMARNNVHEFDPEQEERLQP